MIRIQKGTANIVVVTLTERVTLDSPVFLFIFKDAQTKVIKACIAADVSDFSFRYNKFVITETDTPDNLIGQVSLGEGFSYYEIYEQESTTNLDPDNAGTLLESGRVKVYDTPATSHTYTNNNTDHVYKRSS